MTASDNGLRASHRKLLERFFAAVGAGNVAEMAALCTEDLVAEMPYNDPPVRLTSFEAYRSFVEPAFDMLKFTLSLGEVHTCTDPSTLIAEYTSDGTAIPTGKPYRNVYIGIWRFREGRICGIREFFNPALTAEALRPD
ncbi:MAG: nuclear transport factor 2 family protein [Deltaproteobacteria bacterium]|nr:nuclear transport factor 2 family protein [Deltaproteobacteria bacterium]MBW2359294.1 nuclear transport factor 2 family protein [Deltaproteobacteria bacterium]